MMVKGNCVLLLLIVLQMHYSVTARRRFNSDEDNQDERRPNQCLEKTFRSKNQEFPSGSVLYKEKIIKIGDTKVEYQLNITSSALGQWCYKPIKTRVKVCNFEKLPTKLEFNTETNVAYVERDLESSNWGLGTIQAFQTCAQVYPR